MNEPDGFEKLVDEVVNESTHEERPTQPRRFADDVIRIAEQPRPSPLKMAVAAVAVVSLIIATWLLWPEQTRITKAMADKLVRGQPVSVVVDAIGEPDNDSALVMNSQEVRTLTWSNSETSKLSCVFINGQLDSVLSENLK